MTYTPFIYETKTIDKLIDNIPFKFIIEYTEEDIPLEKAFKDTTIDINELQNDIDNGKLTYGYICITAYINNIKLAWDSVGSCVYKDIQDFIDHSGYYDDMINDIVYTSVKTIKQLSRYISKC